MPWELLGTLRSRWAVHFSGNCVPAVKKSKGTEFPCVPAEIKPCQV